MPELSRPMIGLDVNGVGMSLSDYNNSIVYVLTNDSMPNMIKIGKTSGDSVERRVAELSRATGVPLPFKVAVARAVHDAGAVETALHVAFGPDRVNPRREFFSISAHRAIAIINAFPGEDLTPQTEQAVEREMDTSEPGANEAVRRYARKRRPPMNFFEMGLSPGSVLVHDSTGQTATVVDAKKVEFGGAVTSLTSAHRKLSGTEYNVQPTPHWSYAGAVLQNLYDRTYPHQVDDEESG
jgi:hypothetical protein